MHENPTGSKEQEPEELTDKSTLLNFKHGGDTNQNRSPAEKQTQLEQFNFPFPTAV